MATSSIDLGVRGLHDVEVVGSGGSAVVYKAVREVPGRFAMQETVAVKVLRSSWDYAARRRFEREQRVMDRLADRAGFVPVLETGETDDGSPYIIMPFYEGGSLQQRISRAGPIEWPRAVRLAEEVARTLAQAHELDVFHRDIKPANILLTQSGRPHVADYGISLIAEDAATRATATAAFTPAYSPPESFTQGLMPVATTDIYGLAATLWATLAGHAPFKDPGEQPTPVTVFSRVAVQQVGDLRSHVPSPICRFIEEAMAKLPDDRPATMEEFLADLQAAREDAYRGVEAERLDVTPLFEADSIPIPEDLAPFRTDDEGDNGDGSDDGDAASDESTITIGILPGETVAGSTRSEDTLDLAGSADPTSAPADVPADVATAGGRGGRAWLTTVVVAAASTVAILLVTWWLLAAGADSDPTEDSLVIVAEGESAADAASSESGRSNGGSGEPAALEPGSDDPDEPGTVDVTPDTAAGPTTAPARTTVRAPTTQRTATTRSATTGSTVDDTGSTTASTATTPSTGGSSATTPSTATTLSTSSTAGAAEIRIVRAPSVVSATGTSVVFSYQTNDVCGTGSFDYTEVETGRLVGRWIGDRGCFGPVHFGETRWPGITLKPGTTYLVSITVEGQPSNGTLPTGTGQASASFQVTTPS